jgi:putative nucleotidyltransferase with HDIG domain
MQLADTGNRTDPGAAVVRDPAEPWTDATTLLRQAFGTDFAIADAKSGNVRVAAELSHGNYALRAEFLQQVAKRGRPELIEEDAEAILVIPLGGTSKSSWVALGHFFGRQTPAAADMLRRMAEMVMAQWISQRQVHQLERELESLSLHIASTYEEISLLHRLAQNLTLSKSDEELGRIALEWLEDALPAQSAAFQIVPSAMRSQSVGREKRKEPILIVRGPCPVDNAQFSELVHHVERFTIPGQPLVLNRGMTRREDWPFPRVGEMILVPVTEGENLFGWCAAFDHTGGLEFGTTEASLLNSVAALLGIHSRNITLYQEQAELMTGIIRALTAAIDAKDQYTCGHSDRVARLAARLAQQLGCDLPTVNRIYLAGLLHDIGKIGIADNVLQKPDKLTDEEYQHIKTHAEIGHKILRDIQALGDIVPVILHHHESWNGRGYPKQLHEQDIPLAARIVAVADSYDAMGSDRPYRKGMPEERIETIFHKESGIQWDPTVVAAFFQAHDDLFRIAHEEGSETVFELPERR